jgi:O-antigen ligase
VSAVLTAASPALRVALGALLAGSATYFASRFSGQSALVNVGYWLSVAALLAALLAGGARAFLRVFATPLALAAAVYFAAAAASILLAPDPALARSEFSPAHGTAIASAMFVAGGLALAGRPRWFVLAVVAGSLLASFNQIGHHLEHWQLTGTPLVEYQTIRRHGPAHAFFLPAVVALYFVARRREERWLLAAVAALEAILLLFAGPRGPWVGIAAAGVVAAHLTGQWRSFAVFAASAVAGAVAVATLVPDSVVKARFEEGVSTSGRVTGTWGPAAALIAERPLSGYGYGQRAFADAFDAAAPRHPEWTERKSIGPHNIYLGAWAAGGPWLLGALLWLFAALALALRRVYRRAQSADLRALALAVLAAFVSAYAVHGLLEDTQWLGFGVLLGLALGMMRLLAEESGASRDAVEPYGPATPVDAPARPDTSLQDMAGPAEPVRWTARLAWLVGVCAVAYVAGRYSHKGGLVNTAFYLGLVVVALYAAATRGRPLLRLLESRVALAAVAFLAVLAYSIQIAPEPGLAVAAFFKSHGHALLVAIVIGIATTDAHVRSWLLAALVLGALPEMVRQCAQHWAAWRTTGDWRIQYELVREFGNAYAFYLPAAVAVLVAVHRRGWRLAAGLLAAVESLLFALTGFRGAWLGAGAGILAIAVVARSWRAVLTVGALAVGGLALLAVLVPDNVATERLRKGLDTSTRAEAVWGPALELAAARPLAGYGYGNEVIVEAYERAYARHPEWVRPEWMQHRTWSPHNVYLAMWLRGGLVALAVLLWLFVEMLLVFVAAAGRAPAPVDRALALAGLGILVSAYVVHGFFEEKLWSPFGIPLGLALGLAAARRSGVASGAAGASARSAR